MADGIPPAMNHVSEPAPTASAVPAAPAAEVSGSAPSTVPTGTAPVTAPIPAPAPGPMEDKKPEEKIIPDGAGPAVAPPQPKPVEVMSVPETPVNGTTPAGGTPRPELDFTAETEKLADKVAEQKRDDPPVIMSGIVEPQSTPKASAPKDEPAPEELVVGRPPGTNGISSKPAEMTGALQTDAVTESIETESIETASAKRKLESAGTNGSSLPEADKQADDDDRADKKVKIAGETATNGGSTAPRKAGRPKKDRKLVPSVGKTVRKTRSQGPAEA